MHKKIGSNGKVIAFEPQPELNQELHALRDAFSVPRLEIAKVSSGRFMKCDVEGH
jgi:hypothetical protein